MTVSLPADPALAARRILLCGKSLLMSGLQASMGAVPELDVQWTDAQPERIRERMSAWQADVVILEAEELKNVSAFLLLVEFPGLKLVSLDVEGDCLLVFSVTVSRELTPEGLLQVIER